jgi:hypothetical protein
MSASPDDEKFDELVEQTRAIQAHFLGHERKWYRRHSRIPFLFFRGAGIVTVVLGVSLPAVAPATWLTSQHKEIALSLMSVAIAALTGLSTFYRWERTWRSRVLVKLSLEALEAKWELEIANARLIVAPADRLAHVYATTDEIIATARRICSAETEEFFSGMQFPKSDEAKKGPTNAD